MIYSIYAIVRFDIFSSRNIDEIDVMIEVEDAAPTVDQVVAYERFWKMVVGRMVREREFKKQTIESEDSGKLAA